ncbi:hypothetical protein CYG49_00370 [Candidatus Saccharibacteria bacterium]|nr:MAG: hypothetical protein CYG49_00370 [Candidatus Saccharibacteria bacterium]
MRDTAPVFLGTVLATLRVVGIPRAAVEVPRKREQYLSASKELRILVCGTSAGKLLYNQA